MRRRYSPAGKKRLDALSGEERAQLLLDCLYKEGLEYLNWTPEAQQLRARVRLAHQQEPARWPAWDDEALLASLATGSNHTSAQLTTCSNCTS